MAKFKSVNDYSLSVKRAFESASTEAFSPEFKTQIAQDALKKLVARVKTGYGVSGENPANFESVEKVRLKPLSEKYVELRKKVKLGDLGSPKRSNLTLTGQMLNDITYELIGDGFKLLFKGAPRSDSKLTNEQVAAYVSANGRPFFSLTKDEFAVIVGKVQRRYREILRKKLSNLGGI